MAPSRRLLIVAVAALLAAPALATAEDRSVADLNASRLRSPDAALAGALAALEDANGTGTFLLHAARIDVTVEQESATAYAGRVPPGGYQADPPRHETHADIEGANGLMRDGHYVDVFPLAGEPSPTVARGPGCAALAPSARDSVLPWEPKNFTIRDRHPGMDTRATLAWDRPSCPAPSWTLAGSFLVILYGADVTLDGTTYTSGHSVQGSNPVGPVNVTEERTNRYVYLAVHGGRMEMLGDPSVFLSSADLDGGRLALDGATGNVPALGGRRLADEAVELAGDLHAHATRAGGAAAGLQVKVTGRLDSSSVGGQSIAVASGGGPPPGLWLAALIALPVVAGGGAAAAWRGGPARRLARLEQQVLLRRAGPGAGASADAVARRSRRLQRHADLHAEATALRVDALARAGRTTEALAAAAGLGGWEGALATAYVHALRDDAPRAVEALRPWQEGHAAMLGAALRQPAFAAVRRHPEAARWLGADA